MRWILLLILAYLLVLVQTTAGKVLVAHTQALGAIGPDLLAIAAVFLAFRAREALDVMLAGWVLGFALDLTSGGGPGAGTVVGPMAISYTVSCWAVYRIREALFRERALTQALVTLIFVVSAHGLWITLQSLLAGGTSWQAFFRTLLQAVGVAVYTAALAPLGFFVLSKVERWFIIVPVGRRPRGRG